VGHTDVSVHGLCLAAVLAAGDGALLSHYSAAWLWGFRRGSPLPVHVVAPVGRTRRRGLVLHRASHLHDEDRAEGDGVPVTSVARTLLDMAALLKLDRLRPMLRRSEELRRFDLRQVEAVLDRNRGHAGSGRQRRALVLYRPPRFTRSGLERDFLSAVERAGLPDPVSGWVELGYELDVYGIELVRVTGRRFEREPRQVIGRVAALLSQRARSLGASAWGGGGRRFA
jgi:hypothetical protein